MDFLTDLRGFEESASGDTVEANDRHEKQTGPPLLWCGLGNSRRCTQE